MAVKLANNATSSLAGSITATDTGLSVSGDDAGKFPALAVGDWFPMTIVDPAGNMEIVKVTARSGAALTIVRGHEGTTAKAFAIGSRCELRMTAAAATALVNDFVTALADSLGDLAALDLAPLTKGGTGATTAVGAADAINTTGANIASAATTNLAAATGISVTVTGTTAITSFGNVSAGSLRIVTFAGALTLTHHATNLILPGAANIVTAAGDVAILLSLGSSRWKCISFSQGTAIRDLLMTGVLTITNASPSIVLSDTTAGSYNTRIIVDANNWYLQKQADGSTSWSTFMQFEMDTTNAYANGSQLLTAVNHPHVNLGTTAASARTAIGVDASLIAALTASLGANGLGTYAFARRVSGGDPSFGQNIAGSNLEPSNVNASSNGSMTGTWKCMGYIQPGASTSGATTAWLKIAA